MRRALVGLVMSLAVVGCSGSDTTHFSCWDEAYLKSQPGLGTGAHKFNAGAGKDHICTAAELDAQGIPNEERPPSQRSKK